LRGLKSREACGPVGSATMASEGDKIEVAVSSRVPFSNSSPDEKLLGSGVQTDGADSPICLLLFGGQAPSPCCHN